MGAIDTPVRTGSGQEKLEGFAPNQTAVGTLTRPLCVAGGEVSCQERRNLVY